MPNRPMAKSATVLASGTDVEAENENCPEAEPSCVVKFQVPGVSVKPLALATPVPSANKNPEPWKVICEAVKSKVKLSTDQKFGIVVLVLNVQGATKVVRYPTFTVAAKLPSRLCTSGLLGLGLGVGFGPAQLMTLVAVFTVFESSVTVPANVMFPTIGPVGGVGT